MAGRDRRSPAASPSGRSPASRRARRLQRDLVVAATEAERARLAADIHDDALQELTLLVRRLEASGDTEGAEIGRTVADRLRAICGDLRLPILDDLGVGPALDWLVLRIERLAGGEVRLERADDARHSPDVELAIFRVAQEALANAVKHGKPPIVVRYRSTPGGISLAIDDAGPGITDDAPGRRREGRPVRAPEHGPAGRADRGDPRRQALAGRRHARRAGVAAALTGARDPRSGSIVDDHPVVREGTAALLAAQPGIEVAGTAGSIDEATALIAARRRPTSSCSTSGSAPTPGCGSCRAAPADAARRSSS